MFLAAEDQEDDTEAVPEEEDRLDPTEEMEEGDGDTEEEEDIDDEFDNELDDEFFISGTEEAEDGQSQDLEIDIESD